jgi:NADPH:quinone reductase-like Zn-dependent oxidoreductase
MKAIVQHTYGSSDVLELSEAEPPVIGKEEELLVSVRAAGVDPGVWHTTAGLPYMVRLMGFGLRAPKNHIPGVDFAGVVDAVGGDVARVRVGDEVYGTTTGSFAELAKASEAKTAPKPPNLTFQQAAAIPVSGMTALQAVRDKGEVQTSDRVLVLGAGGGVGHFAVQIAKAFGAEVTGVCSTARVELVRSLGADHVVDRTVDDFTSTGPYDVIIDTAGRRSLSGLRRILAPGGRLVIVGGEGGNRWTGGFERQMIAPLLSPVVRQKTIRPLIASESSDDLTALNELIEAGKVSPALDRTFGLPEAAEAIRYVHSAHARGKVVLTV